MARGKGLVVFFVYICMCNELMSSRPLRGGGEGLLEKTHRDRSPLSKAAGGYGQPVVVTCPAPVGVKLGRWSRR